MKLSTPEIVWHGKEPVFSADFHRNGAVWRLATAGADQDVKVGAKQFIKLNIAESLAEVNLFKINIPQIWKVVRNEDSENGKTRILFMANLSRHTKAVNVVRFSPNGTYSTVKVVTFTLHSFWCESCTLQRNLEYAQQ